MRVPNSRSGRLLVACRDKVKTEISEHFRNGDFESDKLLERIEVASNFTRRIKSRLQREDSNRQVMMSDHRTVIVFQQHGKLVTGKYVGTIDQAKENLKRTRGVKQIRWAHFTKGHEMLISGMWIEIDVY